MAQAYNYYSADGGTDSFEFTQELSEQSVVVGYVDWVLTSGTWDSGTGFYTFDSTPAASADIHIVRSTSNNTMVATFPNKSYITSDNLDADHRQHLLQVQELEFMDMLLNYLMGGGALTAATAAAASAAAAATSETNAATSETNAGTSETNAAASAAVAAASVASMIWQDVLFKSNADSPITIGTADKAHLIAVDTSAGNVVINLPTISGETLPFNLGVKKTTSDTNTVTINRGGTDTIDGNTSVVLSTQDHGVTLVADDDTAPDIWTSLEYSDTPADNTVSTAKIQSSAVTTDKVNDSAIDYSKLAAEVKTLLGRRNAIINGNFDIWQRGTSFAAASNNDFTADRWKYKKTGAIVHTVSQSSDVPTYAESGILSNYSLHLDVTTADTSLAASDYSQVRYRVEGYDYAQLAGGNATLSFWVKGAKTGVHCIAIKNSGSDRTYVSEYTIAVANTWEKKEIIVPITETGGTWDYTNGIGLTIDFVLAAGSNYHTTADSWQTGNYYCTSSQVNEGDSTSNNFRIAQVQLERGDIATPFEFRPFAEEVALCKRYFERWDNTDVTIQNIGSGYLSSGGTNGYAYIQFEVEKRAIPTMSYSNVSHFYVRSPASKTVTSITFPALSRVSYRLACVLSSAGTAGHGCIIGGNAVGAYIDADAEL